ncbi:MAG: hypothetical protein JST89_13690 [Cyanobacteria bacterium SZAS-4]|nr:hypothetical protein [Cyanobacteria bacterium SZAS-4]
MSFDRLLKYCWPLLLSALIVSLPTPCRSHSGIVQAVVVVHHSLAYNVECRAETVSDLKVCQNKIGPGDVPANIYDALPPRNQYHPVKDVGPIIQRFKEAFPKSADGPATISVPQQRTLERAHDHGVLNDELPVRSMNARDPVKLKCFVPPILSIACGPGPGLTPKQQQESLRQSKAEHTLSKWLFQLNKTCGSVHNPIFANSTVSYVVSFDGKSEVGTLRLWHGGSEEANREALRIIRAVMPVTQPPDDIVYRRGLIFRFTSRCLEIGLAPRRG